MGTMLSHAATRVVKTGFIKIAYSNGLIDPKTVLVVEEICSRANHVVSLSNFPSPWASLRRGDTKRDLRSLSPYIQMLILYKNFVAKKN